MDNGTYLPRPIAFLIVYTYALTSQNKRNEFNFISFILSTIFAPPLQATIYIRYIKRANYFEVNVNSVKDLKFWYSEKLHKFTNLRE